MTTKKEFHSINELKEHFFPTKKKRDVFDVIFDIVKSGSEGKINGWE